MFTEREYIAGDCAFATRCWLVSCYKKPPGGTLARDKEIFNKSLARPRVTSEHVNGMLKGRFPFLRSIRFRINRIASRRPFLRPSAKFLVVLLTNGRLTLPRSRV